MAKTVEVYFGIDLASLVCDLYNAGTTTVAANDVTFNQSDKPGYFVGNIGTLAAGLYDLVETTGLGADQVKVGEADNTLYKCYGHSFEWTQSLSGGSQAPAGQYAVGITIQDQSNSTPIQGAVVSVFSSGTLVGSAYSNSLGVATINLAAGSYTINVTATNYGSVSGTAHTVSASTGTHTKTIQLTQATIPSPGTVGICTVAVDVVRAGVPVIGSKVEAIIKDKNSLLPSGLALVSVFKGTTNNSGRCLLSLPYSANFLAGDGVYIIKATDPNTGNIEHHGEYQVPSFATRHISQLTVI